MDSPHEPRPLASLHAMISRRLCDHFVAIGPRANLPPSCTCLFVCVSRDRTWAKCSQRAYIVSKASRVGRNMLPKSWLAQKCAQLGVLEFDTTRENHFKLLHCIVVLFRTAYQHKGQAAADSNGHVPYWTSVFQMADNHSKIYPGVLKSLN